MKNKLIKFLFTAVMCGTGLSVPATYAFASATETTETAVDSETGYSSSSSTEVTFDEDTKEVPDVKSELDEVSVPETNIDTTISDDSSATVDDTTEVDTATAEEISTTNVESDNVNNTEKDTKKESKKETSANSNDKSKKKDDDKEKNKNENRGFRRRLTLKGLIIQLITAFFIFVLPAYYIYWREKKR